MSTKLKRLVMSLLGVVSLAMFLALALVPKSDALVEYNDTTTVVGKPIKAAQGTDGIQRLLEATGGTAKVTLNRATNVARFVVLETNDNALSLGNFSPEEKAARFFNDYGDVFGVRNPDSELIRQGTDVDVYGTTRVSYEQVYQGFPVFGGQLYAHFDGRGELTAVNGAFVPNIAVNIRPTLSADAAAQEAVATIVSQQENDLFSVNLSDVNNDMLIFRTGLVQGIDGLNYLAYRVEVADPARSVREFVFVDAHTGKILDQITGIHEDLDRKIYLEAFDPAALVWQEGDTYPYVGTEELGINRLIDYAEDSYDLFYNISGGQVVSATAYDSYDGNGATMHSVYNDPRINCPNANWNGVSTNYCTDVDGDDTVAHEWTHAYQDFTHGLIYQWQPGALNESYSDVFGEIVDMVNGAGTDSPDTLRTAGACSVYTPAPPILTVTAPGSIAGDYDAGVAQFGPAIDGTLTGTLKLVDDGTGATSSEGCNPLVNDLTGNIAFVRRGSCNFTTKVKNAQDAGAIGVIVANHEDGGDNTITMSGDDSSITIQSLFIGYTDGNTIEAELGTGVDVIFALDTGPIAPDDSYRWLSGEDDPAFGGAIRDMWTPGCYGDPGEVIEDNYMCGTADGGGVHTNSGVPNHAFALLVDGGTHNSVAVAQVGLTKTAAIYWRSMSVYQSPTTDFAEHADALEQSCTDLIGQDIYDPITGAISSVQIDAADCTAVANAMLAVEMREDPTAQCAFEPLLEQSPPDVCAGIGNPVNVYTTTFESGAADWSMSTDVAFPDVEPLMWELTSTLPGGRAGSAFYAIDEQGGSCNADADDDSRVLHLDGPEIVIPAAATHPRVTFWHWVATELEWDGGNVKISVNGGPWQLVEGRFYTFNAYNDTMATAAAGNSNPLAGEEGFTGSDGGSVQGTWGQSQVNVGRYAIPGDTIQLRFDFGSDGCSGLFGWYVDDVDVLYCDGQVDPDVALFTNGIEDNENGFGLSSSLSEGETERTTLEIMNTGIGDLSWTIEEEAVSLPTIDVDVSLPPMPAHNVSDLLNIHGFRPETPSVVEAASVVQDGGFEAATTYWANYDLPSSDVSLGPICDNTGCGPFSLNGEFYLWYGGWGAGVNYGGGVSQTVNLANTGDATLSFWLWWPDAFGPNDVFTATLDSTPVFTATAATGVAYGVYTEVMVDISSFADGGSHVLVLEAYVEDGASVLLDDVAIDDNSACLSPSDISWIGALKTGGILSRDTSEEVSIIFDSTGLMSGVYEANICVNSNAPDRPVLAVPVSLQVLYDTFMPFVAKE